KQDFGVHACHSRLPHNVHDDDIRLRNTRRIIAATLESEYSRITRRNHHLIGPSEPQKMALSFPLTIYLAQGFFATRVHKCSSTIYVSSLCWTLSFLRFVGVVGITV